MAQSETMGQRLADIFLSYNREDQAVADRFVKGFEAAGLTVWWDARLRAGEAYDEVTENALREAGAVVVLWSKRSVASRWVRAEATLAQRCGTFFPCMIEPCERPIMFELTQSDDLTGWAGDTDDPAWQHFCSHVRAFVSPKGRVTEGTPSPTAHESRLSSERRQIVFLAATLDEGDRHAASLDPEEWQEILLKLRAACQPIIDRYQGKPSWRGHSATVTFGFPIAQEDAAQRAIHTALEMAELVGQLQLPEHAEPSLSLKCGIHASHMLVASNGGDVELIGDGAAISETARDVADRGTILVSPAIKALASGAFRMDQAQTAQNGEQFFIVSRQTPEKTSARGWETGEQTVFVGRDDELGHLRGRWTRTLDSEGQLVMIRGEPGIGKSRLVEQFRQLANDTDHVWLALQGSSLFPNTPYFPLGQMIDLQIEDSDADYEEALGLQLDHIGLPRDLATLFSSILGTGGDGTPDSVSNNETPRPQFVSKLVDAIFELAQSKPVVLFADDLQWVDPSTLEILQLLAEQNEDDRLLILGTARPEFEPPWSEGDHHSRINLARLPNSQLIELVNQAVGDEPIDQNTLRSIIEKADGVPLFAEELAKLTNRQGGMGALPPTLRSLLAARMDRLGAARELLQVCSVLGACPYPIVAAMMAIPPAELDEQLRQLTEEQLIIVRGKPPHSRYRFKHALLQDGAYETLTRSRRQDLHGKAARTILEQFPDIAESQPELVATHWTQARQYGEAVAAWLDTARREHQRGASREAAAHLKQGLDLIEHLAAGPERDEIELDLNTAMSEALQKSLGYSHPDTIAASDRARELARKLGSLERLALGEAQLWRATVNTGHYDDADQLAKRIGSLVQELDEKQRAPWMLDFTYTSIIQTAFYSGRLNEVEEPYAELEKTFGIENDVTNIDGQIVSIGVGSLAAWMVGNSTLARRRAAQAIELAENSKQPYAIAVAHHFAGTMMAFDEDLAAAKAHTERALAVCDENGIEALGHLVKAKIGWLTEHDAPSAASIIAMRNILDAMVAANARVGLVINMNRLAMALEARDEIDEAYAAVCEALEANPQERIVRPETLQIRGRIEGKMGREDEARNDFMQAMKLAAEIGAKAFELSAAIDLAQCLCDQGKPDEARANLTRVLDNCGPEVDTPALGRARALQTKWAQGTAS